MRLNGTKGAETARNSLRDRKKAATRKALQEAALRLFSRDGFVETSVDRIAAEADVSRSTFFRYFGSKEAVLFAEMDKQGEMFLPILASRPDHENAVVAFEEALVALSRVTDPDSNREASRSMERLFQHDPALGALRNTERDRWAGAIATVFARRHGAATANDDDELAAAICMAVTERIGRDWREGDHTYSVEDAIRKGFESLRGVVGAESRAEVNA